jgi:hypothetical protein
MDDDEEEEEDSSFQSSAADNNSREHIGTLVGRSTRALQNQAAFLNGRPVYGLLYFWEVADRHQALQSSLKCLNNNIGSSFLAVFGAVSSSSRRHRQRRDDASP